MMLQHIYLFKTISENVRKFWEINAANFRAQASFGALRIFQNINYIGSSTDIHVLFLEVTRFYLNQLETEDPNNNLKKKKQ